MSETVLVLNAIGVPPYSARGLKQTLEPIAASSVLRRTINGSLVDFGYEQFRKYQSVITGADQDPPAVDLVWPGNVVEVSCVTELAFMTSAAGPGRPAVSGSQRTEGDFTFYRPLLQMRVATFSIDRDEWGAAVGWQLHLEEI